MDVELDKSPEQNEISETGSAGNASCFSLNDIGNSVPCHDEKYKGGGQLS